MLVGYSFEEKGYKCFNPSTLKVRVSQDVLFDESTSWYKPESTPLEPSTNDLDHTKDDDQLTSIPKESPTSTRLSGRQEPPSDRSTSWPRPKMDKGKKKMPEYQDDQFDNKE